MVFEIFCFNKHKIYKNINIVLCPSLVQQFFFLAIYKYIEKKNYEFNNLERKY
jgi:hypothetical protein